MNRIFHKLNWEERKNKYLLSIGAVILCLLLMALGFRAFIPKGYAAGTDKSDPIEVSMNTAEKKFSVTGGNYYIIKSGTYTQGITLTTETRTGDIYLILDNVSFFMSSDEPAVSFVSRYRGETESTDKLNIHIILKDESVIKGYAGGKEPLIKAENYSFATEVYGGTSISGPGTESSAIYYSQNIEMYIEEYDGDSRHVITLETGDQSYGAAIGSAEAQAVIDDLKDNGLLDINMNTSESNKVYPFRSPSWTEDTPYNENDYIWVYREGTYLSNKVRFEFGAAPVTIKSGVVNIKGNGYGAGIGNGGSYGEKVSVSNEELVTIKGEPINNVALQNTGQVTVEGGTVSVVMSQDSKGSCFINGSKGDETAEDGLVYIDGGSVYIKRQCDYTQSQPYENAYNTANQKLYLYEAEYGNNLQGMSNTQLSGELFDLKNVYGAEENYSYSVSSFKNSDGSTGTFAAGENYLDAKVARTGYEYIFKGYYHDSAYADGENKLYFYLPSVKLKDFTLRIEDNCEQVSYGTYTDRDSNIITSNAEILSKYNYTDYDKKQAGGITVKENSYIVIKASNIPSYCTGISFKYTQTGESGGQNGSYTPIKDSDGNYYVCLSYIQGDITGTFTYNMGSYSIEYDYGLLESDRGAVISNDNPGTSECGTTVQLKAPSWDNHIFDGWYTDSSYNVSISEVSSVKVNDTIKVYAKWKCIVKYETDEGTINGTKEHTVEYGKTFNIMDNVPSVELPDDMKGLIELTGWQCGENIYSDTSEISPIITVTENITITAKFKRSGYYVYITALYGDGSEKADILQYADSFRMIYANNAPQGFGNIDSQGWYRTTGFVDKTQPATVSIVPKAGYKMISKTVTDENGNSLGLISEDTALNQFSFNMPEYDIYITVTFDVETYNIKYYDISDSGLTEISGEPNPSSYTILTESFKFVRPDNVRGKYWRFTGWKEIGKDNVIEGIDKGTSAKDMMLVASWEEVELYDIVIEENDIGIIKAYVDGEEVVKAAEGETIEIVAWAGPGVKLTALNRFWNDESGNMASVNQVYDYDIINTSKTIAFEMPGADVNVSGEFELVKYLITYLNLDGSVNTNPTVYTVGDSFYLEEPVKEGWTFIGWKLIIPDSSTDNQNDVAITDIEKIENMYGNLMIYALWEETGMGEGSEDSKIYHATVDESIINGYVALDKTEAESNEPIFVRVEEKDGYKLKSLEYSQTQGISTYVSPLLRTAAQKSTSVDIFSNKVADGVYYFMMPDSDVEVTAVFEPIVYNITYNTRGGQHSNVTTYTVEDNIVLSDASREGYSFTGWYDQNGNKVLAIDNSVGDIVLTAQWEKAPSDSSGEADGNDDNDANKEADNKTEGEESLNPSQDNNDNDAQTESRPNTYVESGKVQTGDSVDIMRLVVICLICAGVMLLLIPIMKKRDNDKENNDSSKEQDNNQ